VPLIYDISSLARWSGPAVGIARTDRELALWVRTNRPAAVFAFLSRGKAIIASTGGALPEVVGEFSPYLDPTDEDAWYGKLKQWITDPSARTPYVSASIVSLGEKRRSSYFGRQNPRVLISRGRPALTSGRNWFAGRRGLVESIGSHACASFMNSSE
jgi:hypothetical protein